jgi:hypothetical protein
VKSYNAYLGIPGREEDPWECTATSVGYERVQRGSPYPPRRHPVDHHFDWNHGRILSAYQLVYVTEGQGAFESEVPPKCHRIEAGAVMTLFPGVWHRYAPDPKTGWVEQDFLANTSKSVGEIADILGFDSAFHLSKQFKDSTGLAPQAWRKRLVGLRAQHGN